MSDPQPGLQLVPAEAQSEEGTLRKLAEKVPPPSLDPREALKNMTLEDTLRRLLEKGFAPFGMTLRDDKARDRYGDVERQFTLAEGRGLQVALLQIPRWITANPNNIYSIDEIRTAFEKRVVRVISQNEGSGTVGLKRMFRDWRRRDDIDAQLVPWQYLKDLEAGRAQLAEILELDLQKGEPAPAVRPPEARKPLIFVSYSHKDDDWLNEIKLQLTPLLRDNETLQVWDDTKIAAGDKWGDQIERALAEATVAVLLVSKNFLGSSFIYQNELPPLMKAVDTRGLTILWVLVSPCRYETIKLDKFQAAHEINESLQGLKEKSQARLDEVLKQIGEKIEKAALGQR